MSAGDDIHMTDEEYDILISDCESELGSARSAEINLRLELDSIRRKIKHLSGEKEYLLMLKSGGTKDLVEVTDVGVTDVGVTDVGRKASILGTLTLRHMNLAKRLALKLKDKPVD